MVTTHNLGFPRIGMHRELKRSLEGYWSKKRSASELMRDAASLRGQHWDWQSDLDYAPVGDFALYDHVLDMSESLGNLPTRAVADGEGLDAYFRAARGRAHDGGGTPEVRACEMTKWFDTNYHYLVPEFSAETTFQANADRLLREMDEARRLGVQPKPVIIGPVTYLWLGKAQDDIQPLRLLEPLLAAYGRLLEDLALAGADWVQIDEPLLVTDLTEEWQQAVAQAYSSLGGAPVKLLLTTYFGALRENLELACSLPVAGLHLDALAAREEVWPVVDRLAEDQVLSLGVIDGRNIWRTDLNATLDWLEPIQQRLLTRLWIAPSCSLLHVPVDLKLEQRLDPEITSWMAFARQKLAELLTLARALTGGREAVSDELRSDARRHDLRARSTRVHHPEVSRAVAEIREEIMRRASPHAVRAGKQQQGLALPPFPTTTIGSFPQTPEIRRARRRHRRGELTGSEYQDIMRREIRRAVIEQEELGLDVLVHGEAERNDMVEYFGEQLEGFVLSDNGWVQSYGSRCVKPPILFGDVTRERAMTVAWTRYAQSLTPRPVKGMLTGPVTILNWSFVRDDQPRAVTCFQLALAIRQEVLDLERAGVRIIQIDEAALRERLPLQRAQWPEYLSWAVDAFRIAAGGVQDTTQIHTHMCYSEFNDIMPAIARMDADVITIETSRSNMELLEAFQDFDYPNQIGPGVYDIHSPNTPERAQMVKLMQRAAQCIPAERLWVNPDCGLKTRRWEEVRPALRNMVAAAKQLRAGLASSP